MLIVLIIVFVMSPKIQNKSYEKISNEQLNSMINRAVLEIEGVAGLAELPPISGGIFVTNIFKNLDIDIYVNILYGYNIPEISWNIQESVKMMLLNDTNLVPEHINVHIQGVSTDNVRKKE